MQWAAMGDKYWKHTVTFGLGIKCCECEIMNGLYFFFSW